jgi:hypothetical protein
VKVAIGERAAAQANIVVGRKCVFRRKPIGVQRRMQAYACRRGHVAKMGDMEAQVLVEFSTCIEVRASSGRSKIPLVHHPSKH